MEVYSDILGMKINVPDNPKRIVSLAPSVTETLFMLGLDEKIVGVSYFCNKPDKAKSKPRVGSYMQVNFDKLLGLEPDLVITTTGAQRETTKKLIEKGVPVYPVPLPISAYGILENIWTIGNLVNKVNEARKLLDSLSMKIAKIINNKPEKALKVYWEINLGGPITAGSPSYIDSGFTLAGGTNIFGDKRMNYFQPDFNEVREKNPDIIVYEPQPGRKITKEEIIKTFIERGWENINAVKNDNVFVTPTDFFAHYGPSFFEAVEWLNNKLNELS